MQMHHEKHRLGFFRIPKIIWRLHWEQLDMKLFVHSSDIYWLFPMADTILGLWLYQIMEDNRSLLQALKELTFIFGEKYRKLLLWKIDKLYSLLNATGEKICQEEMCDLEEFVGWCSNSFSLSVCVCTRVCECVCVLYLWSLSVCGTYKWMLGWRIQSTV